MPGGITFIAFNKKPVYRKAADNNPEQALKPDVRAYDFDDISFMHFKPVASVLLLCLNLLKIPDTISHLAPQD